MMPEIDWLDDAQTLTYLHATISTRRYRVGVPEVPFHIDALLTDSALVGGLAPMLGDQHLRVVSVRGFPTSTWPGILDDLNRLGFAYRWSTRLMPEIDWLDDAQTLTYLHATISTRRYRIGVPEVPFHIDALLTDSPLVGGIAPMLGDQHLRVVSVRGFPTSTWPGILDDLNRLGFAYRWSTRCQGHQRQHPDRRPVRGLVFLRAWQITHSRRPDWCCPRSAGGRTSRRRAW